MSMQQTTSGKNLYALPGVSGRQILAPAKAFMMIMGLPDSGKSNFVESHPGAYILNLDQTSTSNADPVAVTWPQFNTESGQTVTPDGKPFTMTWDDVEKILTQLEELSKNNQPRPETVVIDSLSAAQSMVKDWTPANIGFASAAGKTFRTMDGRQAYDFLYDTILNTCLRLRAAGYGVILIGHTQRKKNTDADGNLINYTIEPAFSDSLFKRLFPHMEINCSIHRVEEQTTVDVQDPDRTAPGGRVIKGKIRKVPQTVTRYVLGFHDQHLNAMYKGRARPKVILPAVGAWELFSNEYNSLVQSTLNSMQGDSSSDES